MITDVPGIRVGHWTDPVGLTGCTVVLCPPGTIGSGEVRGGAPATHETDLLRPGMLVQEVNAVLLTGGSAFGLAAVHGVMRFLEEQGIGFDARIARVPIVPAAALFDLGVGDPAVRPGPDQGYLACQQASASVPEGNVGAGTGATVAKLYGMERAVKGGLGTAAQVEGDLVVAALAAVNALGEVIGEDDQPIAAARPGPPGQEGTAEGMQPPFGNTTLVVVATNATLSKERAQLLAQVAHDGVSAAIRPSHTRWDGDIAFALATREVVADQRETERLAEAAVAEAIRRAVIRARSVPGVPSAAG